MVPMFSKIAATVGVYGVIAFTTGFALMAYELAASRILAPSVGSSTYVWTSVIGVIIAALALGFAFGGWLADKRVAKADVAWLLIAAAMAVTSTLLFYDNVLALFGVLFSDDRLRAVAAAVILFMPASFLIGAVSPYLVRLRNQSLATTGRSAASLSAMNALGGITGTFCVGFIFFGYIGARETIVSIILLLLLSSWLVAPARRLKVRVLICLMVGILILLSVFSAMHQRGIAIDTATTHYRVEDTQYKGQSARLLITGPYAAQSGMHADGSSQLLFDYARRTADIVALAPKHDRILVIGGGAFSLPRYFADTYPTATIDVVEIDPALPGIAAKYFNYQPNEHTNIYTQDARSFLLHNQQTYDVIIVDAFGELTVPFSLATVEYAANLERALTPQGVVIVNLIGSLSPACAPLLTSVHGSYAHTLQHNEVFAMHSESLQVMQNVVAVYSNQQLAWLQPLKPLSYRLLNGTVLTDNLAPVERFAQQCRGSK